MEWTTRRDFTSVKVATEYFELRKVSEIERGMCCHVTPSGFAQHEIPENDG